MEFILDKLNIKDDHRYSRQSYSIGRDVMCKINNTTILIIGYNTLSLEITKNLVLLGINNIDIEKNNILKNYEKTGLYYPEEDDSYLNKLRELNPTININSVNILKSDNLRKELRDKKIGEYPLSINSWFFIIELSPIFIFSRSPIASRNDFLFLRGCGNSNFSPKDL